MLNIEGRINSKKNPPRGGFFVFIKYSTFDIPYSVPLMVS